MDCQTETYKEFNGLRMVIALFNSYYKIKIKQIFHQSRD